MGKLVCDCDDWEDSFPACVSAPDAGPGSSFDPVLLYANNAFQMREPVDGSGMDSCCCQRLPDPDQHTFDADCVVAVVVDYCVIGITWKDWTGISFSFSVEQPEHED